MKKASRLSEPATSVSDRFTTIAAPKFNQRPLGLLSALTYSPREKSKLSSFGVDPRNILIVCYNLLVIIRLGADLMNLFFTFDEYSDIKDRDGVQKLREIVSDAFHNPDKPRPENEVCLGAIARE